MSGARRRPAGVRRFAGERIVVTCEHASNAIPMGVTLGVTAAVLRSPVAWDKGARELASILAHRLGAAQFMGRHTRLVVDLDRNRGSPGLIPKQLHGVAVPGNHRLTRAAREERIATYWQPYREMVEAAIAAAIERAGACLHLTVHSFVPQRRGEVGGVEVGLLYDPRREHERVFVRAMGDHLGQSFVEARTNFPSRGPGGITSAFRRRFPARRYLGIQLEVNQHAIATDPDLWRMGRVLSEAVAATTDD